jgi:chromosome segregation ATPase
VSGNRASASGAATPRPSKAIATPERVAYYKRLQEGIQHATRKLERATQRRSHAAQELEDLKKYVDASRTRLNVAAHRAFLKREKRLLKRRAEIATETEAGRRHLKRRIAAKRTAAVTERLRAFLVVARALATTRNQVDRASWRSLRQLWRAHKPQVQHLEQLIDQQLPSPRENAVESVTHQLHTLRTTVANAGNLFDDFRQFFRRRLCWLYCQQHLALLDTWRVPE